MGKGYAEGPAAEDRLDAFDRGELLQDVEPPRERKAVYGSTPDDETKHFIGWTEDVDPDDLFASGKAWGISVVRRVDRG